MAFISIRKSVGCLNISSQILVISLVKHILAEIVQGMFLNSATHLHILGEMKRHALDMFEAIQLGNFEQYGRLVGKSWEQNKALDSGTNPPAVEAIINRIKDEALGYKLPGAGGGGYLYVVAKDPDAARRIRQTLMTNPANDDKPCECKRPPGRNESFE